MSMEYSKLRGRIVEKFGTISAFAEAIGASIATISMKLNGKTEFSKKDIEIWAKHLDIATEEYCDYFFTCKV